MAGYFILYTKWHDLTNLGEYQKGARVASKKYGAKPLVYDVASEVVEGESPYSATVILEFEDLETAKAWYHSPEYQAVVGLRLASSEGTGRFVETLNSG